MQYLILVYDDESRGEVISASERAAFDQTCLANVQALRESGYLLAALRLQKPSAATTVRVQKSGLSLTEGSYTGTAEQLAAVYIINARDLNEAVRITARMPQECQGLIEIRSMMGIDWMSKSGD
jgi:hypothetical protein